MQNFIARDVETGVVMANRVTVASRRLERAVGLLGRNHLDVGEALWITPCHGVHTWFMRFSIDVVAMDANGVVVDTVSTMKPWRMRLPRPGAFSVLELPAGTLLTAPTKVGRRIEILGSNSAFSPAVGYENAPAKTA
jgi:uncharacterized membrane protein (UPF0127 family)